jgi:phage N-6-adenine-methyltransferase
MTTTTNNYATKLAALKQQAKHLLKEVGDQWRTPDDLYWGIFAKFGPFILDLFSDGENAKCPNFYTVEDNALTKDWTKDLAGGKAFANPPYSRSSYEDKQAVTGMRNIIAKSLIERDKGAKFVYLIKSATSEVWWPEDADHVCFIRGRISFDLPEWFKPADKTQAASSAGFACAIAVFDKTWRGERMSYINRDDLLRDGQIMLDMIDAAANKLTAAGAEDEPVNQVETDEQWEDNARWSPTVTNLVNSILVRHSEYKKRSIRDQLCDEATELRASKVSYDEAEAKLISLMKEIGAQKVVKTDQQIDIEEQIARGSIPEKEPSKSVWPNEVLELVEQAFTDAQDKRNNYRHRALCMHVNQRILESASVEAITAELSEMLAKCEPVGEAA